MSNPDNHGLLHPITILAPIVKQFATPTFGRADIWALATTIGVNMAHHGQQQQQQQLVSFNMNWTGRVDCEQRRNAHCVDHISGQQVQCGATTGPPRSIPSVDLTSDQLFRFFQKVYNMTKRQGTALLGAHTVGAAFTEVTKTTTTI